MPCYTNNTDVELGWAACWGGGGGLHGHPITHHTEEAFVGAGATLSAPLFWLSLHAPVPKQIRVCEGFEWDPEVTLRRPVGPTRCWRARSSSCPHPDLFRGPTWLQVWTSLCFPVSSLERRSSKAETAVWGAADICPRKHNKTWGVLRWLL